MSRFVEPAVRHQKSAIDKKAHGFEYKMIIVMYHPKSFLVYKQVKFVLKMIIECHPE